MVLKEAAGTAEKEYEDQRAEFAGLLRMLSDEDLQSFGEEALFLFREASAAKRKRVMTA
jgi:hypothetical protein